MTNNKTPQAVAGKQTKALQQNSQQNKSIQVQAKPKQHAAPEVKQAYQTYIYRSYGGGYQGL